MLVGSAEVRVSPDSSGFGAKTEAQIRKALAGVTANVEITLDGTALRTKVNAAVKAATAGIQAKIGTDIDTSPITTKVKKAVADAAATIASTPGAQLDLFDIDPAKLTAEVTAAKAAASAALAAGKQLELKLDFDTDEFAAKVAAANAAVRAATGDLEASAGRQLDPAVRRLAAERALQTALEGLDDLDVEVDMTVDDDGFRSEVSRVVRSAEAGQKVKVPVDIGGGGGGDADRVGAAAGGIFGRAVLRSAARVLAAGGLAQIFTAATSGAVALGGALISATGAAGSLVSVVSVLPGILSAAAQAAASIGFALGGVGGALKAYTSMQNAIGKAAAGGGGGGGDSGASARAAERAIRNAQRGVEDAYRSAADAVENANERIEESGRSLIRAQRSQQDAQEDLTQARIEAREEAEELRRSVERLSLTEAEARRRLAEARIRNALAQQRAEMDLTGVTEETLKALERQAALEDKAAVNPREKAANDLRDAELDLEEATAKRIETQEKLAEFDRTGVEGTERVIEAKERLADANEEVIDRERDLIKANRDLVRAQEDGARRIADAQENLADAIASAAEGAAGAAGGAAGAIDAYEAALARLSPAARRFVEFLVSLEPTLRRVQATAAQGLFPGLEQAITALLPLVGDLEPIIGATAKTLADLAIEGANLIASPAFRGDLVTIGQRNIDIITGLGRAAISGGNSLRYITIAAGPLTQHLVDLTQHFALLIEQALALGRANGSLDAFFGRVQGRLDRLIVTLVAFGTGLFRVFREATPAGDKYLDTLAKLAVRFEMITDNASKSGALRDFFESTRPAVEALFRLIGDLASGLTRLGTENFGAFTLFAEQLRTELLPVLLQVLSTIDTDFLSALISLTTGMANLFGAVLVGNPTLTLLVNTLAELADTISDLLTNIPVLSPILQTLLTAFGALAVVGAVVALKQFASSIFGVEKALMAMTGSANAAALAQTRVGAAAATAGAIMTKAFLIGAVILAAKSALDALAPSVDKVVASVVRAKDPLAAFEDGLRKLNNPGFFDKLILSAKEAFSVEGVLKSLRENFSLSGRSGVEFGSSTEDAFRKLASTSAATAQQVIDQMNGQGKSTVAYQRILEDVINEKAKQGIAESDVQKKIDAATRALQTNNEAMQEHTDKMRAATNQALSLSSASIGTEEAFDRLTDSLVKNGLNFDITSEKGRENKRMLDNLVGSIQREIEELGKAAAAGSIDNQRKEALLAHLNNLANSGYPGAKEQAARLRLELEAIQAEYRGVVSLDTTRAVAAIDDLTTRLAYLQRVGISAQNNINRGTAGDPDFREFGGRVQRNAAYIVGEKRPELFIPDRDGVILPQVPPLAIPTGLDPGATDGPISFSGTSFDMDGLLSALRDLEATLTEQLASDGRVMRPEDTRATEDTPRTVTVEQTINGPLVRIEQTFGPGSAAADIIEAMHAVAKDEIAVTLAEVLKDHGAGVGARD